MLDPRAAISLQGMTRKFQLVIGIFHVCVWILEPPAGYKYISVVLTDGLHHDVCTNPKIAMLDVARNSQFKDRLNTKAYISDIRFI